MTNNHDEHIEKCNELADAIVSMNKPRFDSPYLLLTMNEIEELEKTNPEAARQAREVIEEFAEAVRKELQEFAATNGGSFKLRLKSRPILKHTSPICKLANELQHGLVNDGENMLTVINADKRRKRNEVSIPVTVTFESSDDISITGGEYEPFDREVQDAITSLYLHGDQSRCFTPEMVYRAMTKNENVHPKASTINRIINSIEKQRRIRVILDATNELASMGLTDEAGNPLTAKFDGPLIAAYGAELKSSGKRVKGYQILAEPLIYSYSRLTGQYITVDAKLLDIHVVNPDNTLGASIANSENRIAIKGYLLRRVEIMRKEQRKAAKAYRNYEVRRQKEAAKALQEERDPSLGIKSLSSFNRQSHRILFDTLRAEAGLTKDSRQMQQQTRDYVFQVLDYWQAIGHITGYQIIKGETKTAKITGVDIEL